MFLIRRAAAQPLLLNKSATMVALSSLSRSYANQCRQDAKCTVALG